MNERERRFVEHFIVSRNATQAALKAGYPIAGASSCGAGLKRKPEIIAALKEAGVDPAAPLPPRELNARQKRFIEEYAALPNAMRAALRAGYGRSAAGPRGHKLLRNPRVVAALKARGVEIQYGAFARDPEDRSRPLRKGELTPRQERFIAEYLVSGRAKEAALRAGFSTRNPNGSAASQLRNPLVAAAIAKGRAEITQSLRVDAARVIEEYVRIAFADIREVVDWGPEGMTLKPQSEAGATVGAALAELVEKKSKSGTRLTLKFHSKLNALEALGKYLGVFPRTKARKPMNQAPSESPGRVEGRDAMAKLEALMRRSLPKRGG